MKNILKKINSLKEIHLKILMYYNKASITENLDEHLECIYNTEILMDQYVETRGSLSGVYNGYEIVGDGTLIYDYMDF